MPTVLREGPYRFFFFAGEGDEPPHVHVERDDRVAKFWLDPVRLKRSGRFTRSELAQVRAIIVARRERLVEAWNEYFHG